MFLCFLISFFCSWCLPCGHIQGYCSLHSGRVLWSITQTPFTTDCRTHPPAAGSAPSHQASLGIASVKRVAPTKVMFLPRAASSKDRSVRESEGLGPHPLTQYNPEEPSHQHSLQGQLGLCCDMLQPSFLILVSLLLRYNTKGTP